MDEYEYPAPTLDIIPARVAALLEMSLNIDAVTNPKAKRLMLRTMEALTNSIENIIDPAPELVPAKPELVTYLGKSI